MAGNQGEIRGPISAPDTITVDFVRKIADAMGAREPIEPNAILRCILWGLDEHWRAEALRRDICRVIGATLDPPDGRLSR